MTPARVPDTLTLMVRNQAGFEVHFKVHRHNTRMDKVIEAYCEACKVDSASVRVFCRRSGVSVEYSSTSADLGLQDQDYLDVVVLHGQKCPTCSTSYFGGYTTPAGCEMAGPTTCTALGELDVFLTGPNAHVARLLRSQVRPLVQLLQSEGCPCYAQLVQTAKAVVEHCVKRGVVAPAELCDALVAYWKYMANGVLLLSTVQALAAQATVFCALRAPHTCPVLLAGVANDPQLAACLVRLGVNRPGLTPDAVVCFLRALSSVVAWQAGGAVNTVAVSAWRLATAAVSELGWRALGALLACEERDFQWDTHACVESLVRAADVGSLPMVSSHLVVPPVLRRLARHFVTQAAGEGVSRRGVQPAVCLAHTLLVVGQLQLPQAAGGTGGTGGTEVAAGDGADRVDQDLCKAWVLVVSALALVEASAEAAVTPGVTPGGGEEADSRLQALTVVQMAGSVLGDRTAWSFLLPSCALEQLRIRPKDTRPLTPDASSLIQDILTLKKRILRMPAAARAMASKLPPDVPQRSSASAEEELRQLDRLVAEIGETGGAAQKGGGQKPKKARPPREPQDTGQGARGRAGRSASAMAKADAVAAAAAAPEAATSRPSQNPPCTPSAQPTCPQTESTDCGGAEGFPVMPAACARGDLQAGAQLCPGLATAVARPPHDLAVPLTQQPAGPATAASTAATATTAAAANAPATAASTDVHGRDTPASTVSTDREDVTNSSAAVAVELRLPAARQPRSTPTPVLASSPLHAPLPPAAPQRLPLAWPAHPPAAPVSGGTSQAASPAAGTTHCHDISTVTAADVSESAEPWQDLLSLLQGGSHAGGAAAQPPAPVQTHGTTAPSARCFSVRLPASQTYSGAVLPGRLQSPASPATAPPVLLPPRSSAWARLVSGAEPPPELCCPITLALLEDPVVAADGHVYTRAAIEGWLGQESTSPMTGLPLPFLMLTPCLPLRSLVDAWAEHSQQHG